jgi:ABC-type transport system involved in multi-copper enzyme maturation permease subunit
MELILWCFIGAISCSLIMVAKNRSVGLGIVFGVLFGIIGIVICACIPSAEAPMNKTTQKICPACKSIIDINASKCKNCTSDVPDAAECAEINKKTSVENIELSDKKCTKCGEYLTKGYALCNNCGHINI